MLFLDSIADISDDNLVNIDWVTMSTSLESRVPLLDHRLVEFIARLPLDYKILVGTAKRIPRVIVAARVPRELADRPKSGFAVPIDVWLRGPLQEWADTLLGPVRMEQDGLLDCVAIQQASLDDYRNA